jgi:receptor protein-tyrosine kinase
MGRIEEALRRTAQPEAEIPTIVSRADGPDGPFDSPWSFGDDEAPAAVAGADAPAVEVATGTLAPAAPRGSRGERLAVFSGFDPAIEERLVVGKGAPPMLTEQFRRLAATLHHAQLVAGTKVIMVTSANPADGKSLTSTNLALTLSESYRREVLLIDADLRRPTLHQAFRVPNVTGLNEGLRSATDGKLAAVKITPTLTLLPAGRPDPDPMSALTSSRMKDIVREAAQRFDWVIIDTAPVGLLADASIVGGMTDGALLVIRAGQTPHAAAQKAIEAFGRERILGVVLNGAETADVGAYGYGAYAANDAGTR